MFGVCDFIQTLLLFQNRISLLINYEETQMKTKAIIALAISAILSGNVYAEKGKAAKDPSCKVNVNKASPPEIQNCLMGFGDKKANLLVQQREKAPFKTLNDLKLVSGVGDKTLEKIRNNVCFDDVSCGSAVTPPQAPVQPAPKAESKGK